MNITKYWDSILTQDAESIRNYFHPNAKIYRHNTNEQFTVDEFICANCEYPGLWAGKIEKCIYTSNLYITAVHVYNQAENLHFHVTSFIHLEEKQIIAIDEYWGEDGEPPQWRKNMCIGRTIDKGEAPYGAYTSGICCSSCNQ